MLGRWLGELVPGGIRLLPVGVLSLALLLRDLGWVKFPLPMLQRQTKQTWAHLFGFRTAAAMWGLHIGIGFATWVKYGGFWAIVSVILATGGIEYGATLMGSYWLGRAFPVWISPWASGTGRIPLSVLTSLRAQEAMFRHASGVALGWTAMVALLMMPGSKAALSSVLNKPVELGWLYTTYILVWALALMPALLLRKVLRELGWLARRIRERQMSHLDGIRGPIPEFSAPVLGTAKVATRADLDGREAIVMFVRPEDGENDLDKALRVSGHALFHKANGNLYVVCTGAANRCQQLLPEFDFAKQGSTRIHVICDEDGSVASLFRVTRTPAAYQLDDKAQIVRFGYQV
jgi:hypothetical protein